MGIKIDLKWSGACSYGEKMCHISMFGIIFKKILLCPLTLEIGHHLHPDISSLYVLSMPRAYPQSFSYAANTARNAGEDEEERCLTVKKGNSKWNTETFVYVVNN